MLPQQNPATGEPAAGNEPPTAPPGLFDDVVGLARDFQALAHDHLQLVALEAKRAGHNLVTMIAAGIGLGILLATVWLGMMGAVVWWLIAIGVAPALALFAMTLLNLAAAGVCLGLIRRSRRSLGFPATLRSLKAASEHRNAA